MKNFFSKRRLLNHGIVELPRDVTGQLDGPDYVRYLGHAEMLQHLNVLNGLNGIWCGRDLELASNEEADACMVLEGQAKVLSIREGFLIPPEHILQGVREGREPRPNEAMTIDFVLTRPPLNRWGPLRYMGLSSKPSSIKRTDSGKRRASREEVALARLGWEWGYVGKPSAVAVGNHKKLRNWAKHCCIDDVHDDALQLAALFYRTTSVKPLRGLLAMFGKRLGISEANQFFAFAAAYYFGYIQLDHTAQLDEDIAPVLKPPALTIEGWRGR
jgi:hypothetical protein